jgi:hypothetical protein
MDLKLVGGLVFLFFFCYLVAAMGNHGRYKRHHENDFGCAVILFVALIVGGGWYAIFGKDSIPAAFGLLLFGGLMIGGYFSWKKERDEKKRDK